MYESANQGAFLLPPFAPVLFGFTLLLTPLASSSSTTVSRPPPASNRSYHGLGIAFQALATVVKFVC